jgi:hypothetical protein
MLQTISDCPAEGCSHLTDLYFEHEAEQSSQIPQTEGADEASILQDLDILQLPEAGCGFNDFTLPLLSLSSPQAAKEHATCHFDILSNINACLILDGKRTCKLSSKAAAIAVVMNNSCLIIT